MGTYDDLSSQQQEVDAAASEIRSRLSGIKGTTQLDAFYRFGQNWRQLIVGRYIMRIEGATLLKVILGVTDTMNVGLKGEYIRPVSGTFITPLEQKLVAGWVRSKIVGSKTELITGAKTDILHGIKFEKKNSTSQEVGASSQANKDARGVVKTGSWVERALFWKHDVNQHAEKITQWDRDIGTLTEECNSFERLVNDEQLKAGSFKDKARSTRLKPDVYQMEATGTVTLEVTANFNARNNGGSLEVQTGGTALRKKGGGFAACGASNVVFKSNGQYILK